MQEAILKVKMDLGNDALILNTRKVRQKGLFKMFSKPLVEVLAAVDEYSSKREPGTPVQSEKRGEIKTENDKNTINVEKKEEKINFLENKINIMESLIQKLISQMQPADEGQVKENEVGTEKPLPGEIKLIHDLLLNNEVEPGIVKQITDTLERRINGGLGKDEINSELERLVKGILGKPETISLNENGKPTVVMLIGPTGVGKTTTLAKLAANYALNCKKNVGLITADTYRIAAVEQLKTYAEILGIPITVVYAASEIRDAVKLHSDKDLVLIDTAGRSHNNRSQFEELKQLVEMSDADEIYLVLSTTTSIASSREILKNYKFLKDYKLIFTKMDEAPVTGIILNIRHLTGKKLSYITNGQNVPDDIEVANIDLLAKKILGRMA